MNEQTRDERLVVIGGGQAAAQLIEVARQEGFAGTIDLVSDEPVLPYQRPPLSKRYLEGKHEVEWLLYRPETFYPANKVAVHLGRRAERVDRVKKAVRLDDGRDILYTKLALVTGARAARIACPGADLPGVYYIRSLSDSQSVRSQLARKRRVVIIGGGFIGLEAAAMMVELGHDVTLLAAQERLIPRVIAEEISKFLFAHHTQHGVKVHVGTQVTEMRARAGGGIDVHTKAGDVFHADLVVVGIGAVPNVELAQEAGLDCDNGISVDEYGRTSDSAIFSAGDCTNHPNRYLGRRLRLETVHNAVEQARTVGATLAGKDLPYIQTPWVWSDQYALRIQSVGMQDGFDRKVVRGAPERGRFSVFFYKGEDLLAVNTVNEPAIFGAVRRLLNARLPLPPADAANPDIDLARLAPRRAKLDFEVPWPKRWEKSGDTVAWGHA